MKKIKSNTKNGFLKGKRVLSVFRDKEPDFVSNCNKMVRFYGFMELGC